MTGHKSAPLPNREKTGNSNKDQEDVRLAEALKANLKRRKAAQTRLNKKITHPRRNDGRFGREKGEEAGDSRSQ